MFWGGKGANAENELYKGQNLLKILKHILEWEFYDLLGC